LNTRTLLAGTAIGVVLGGILLNAPSVWAQLTVTDPISDVLNDTLITALQNAATAAISTLQNAVNDTLNTNLGDGGSIATTLRQGFTQEANYLKGQIGAVEQITDASNTAMALYQRQFRNVEIRDDHVTNPVHCASLDNQQAITIAAGQSWAVSQSIQQVADPRGEGGPNQPANAGQGQAVAAIDDLHRARYCSATDAEAGVCTPSANPNADQRASSLFGTGTYADQTAVTAANDYATHLIQPIVPAALRGSQLTSQSGREAAVRRREYNARMSLAHDVVDYAIAIQTPSVPLTPAQQQQLQNEGLPAATTGSWYQGLALEVDRRISDINWAAQLQAMPPASVEREIAMEIALNNYLQFQNFRVALYAAVTNAALLATSTERDFRPATQMPSPSIVAN
jgi:hypothetical protein